MTAGRADARDVEAVVKRLCSCTESRNPGVTAANELFSALAQEHGSIESRPALPVQSRETIPAPRRCIEHGGHR